MAKPEPDVPANRLLWRVRFITLMLKFESKLQPKLERELKPTRPRRFCLRLRCRDRVEVQVEVLQPPSFVVSFNSLDTYAIL